MCAEVPLRNYSLTHKAIRLFSAIYSVYVGNSMLVDATSP